MTDIAVTSNEPTPDWGPAMRALHPNWRKAALALFETGGNRTEALRRVGYKNTNQLSIRNTASKMFADARMRAAIREEAMARIDLAEPELLKTVLEILRDTGVKAADRLAAARMIWDRANPILTKHKIEVEHHLSVDQLDVEHYRALQKLGAPRQAFIDKFGFNGLPRIEAMVALEDRKHKLIETDYHEVDNGEG